MDPEENTPISAAAIRTTVLGLATQMRTRCMGLIDDCPEPFKPQLTKLKDDIDAALSKLDKKPTEQIPAAQEASWSLRYAAQSLKYMQEMYDSSMNKLAEVMKRVSGETAQLNSLQGQIDGGQLLGGEALTSKIEEATAAARKEERERYKLLSDRRTALMGLGLPFPADTALEGDKSQFDAAQKKAGERFKLLTEAGADVKDTQLMTDLVYGSDAEFDRAIKLLKISGGKGGSSRQENGEPLAGGQATNGKPRFTGV